VHLARLEARVIDHERNAALNSPGARRTSTLEAALCLNACQVRESRLAESKHAHREREYPPEEVRSVQRDADEVDSHDDETVDWDIRLGR